MHIRLAVISAACLSICVAPASSTSLLAAAAAGKGVLLGAGLTAMKTSGGGGTVIVQAESGSEAQVVPADHMIHYQPIHPQTVTYAVHSSSPLSRLWGAMADAIAAKTRAFGNMFSSPNRVVIVNIPPSTTTTPKPTTKKPHKPIIEFEVEASYNPNGQRVYPIAVDNYVKK